MVTKDQAIDIVEKFNFFYGQRAGRELWNDKPFEVQEKDIANFSRDCESLVEYISCHEQAEGEWIHIAPYTTFDGRYLKACECSVCHAFFVSNGNEPFADHPFCCECGAKMNRKD